MFINSMVATKAFRENICVVFYDVGGSVEGITPGAIRSSCRSWYQLSSLMLETGCGERGAV